MEKGNIFICTSSFLFCYISWWFMSFLCWSIRWITFCNCQCDMQAKTAFPGLGSPITHVDVTYDGKWVLATTDTYLMLISTVFKDKDGKSKTGFSGRMGSKSAAPRLLKLLPVDSCRDGKQQNLHGGKFSWVSPFITCLHLFHPT